MPAAKTHPIYHRPSLHCGKCHNLLVFPRKKETDNAEIAAGRAVLAECVTCAVGVMIPPELFTPSSHKHVQVVQVTHAMRVEAAKPYITLGKTRITS
jgi:hypothetical protein